MLQNRYKEAFEELKGTLSKWEENYETGTFNDPQEVMSAFKQVMSDITDKYQFGESNGLE